ncbi:MAG: hypothetical protein LBC09_03400 [Helicobacteraceae bacterium]|jgi:hypothetical protein|nr:hypothetical protein [Helicobacteraceae bacterium]
MDKKAKAILLKTHWQNGGWIDRQNRSLNQEEFEYAKAKGVMFDNITIGHDRLLNEILEIAQNISIEKVAKAFLCAFTNKRLDWRSAIASHFIASKLKKHSYQKAVSGHGYSDGKIVSTSYICGICRDTKYGVSGYEKYIDEDLNELNFERVKWGGVRHGQLIYTWLDLKLFAKEETTEPNREDIGIFKNVLKTVETSQINDYAGALEKRLSECMPSNKNERKMLIEIMACFGLLNPRSYDRPTRGKHDWLYAEYWRGEDQYDRVVAEKYFGNYL